MSISSRFTCILKFLQSDKEKTIKREYGNTWWFTNRKGVAYCHLMHLFILFLSCHKHGLTEHIIRNLLVYLLASLLRLILLYMIQSGFFETENHLNEIHERERNSGIKIAEENIEIRKEALIMLIMALQWLEVRKT